MTPELTVTTTADLSNTKLVTILQVFTTVIFVHFLVVVRRRFTGVQHRKIVAMAYGTLTNCTIVLPGLTIAPTLVVFTEGYVQFLAPIACIMSVRFRSISSENLFPPKIHSLQHTCSSVHNQNRCPNVQNLVYQEATLSIGMPIRGPINHNFCPRPRWSLGITHHVGSTWPFCGLIQNNIVLRLYLTIIEIFVGTKVSN